MYFMRIVCLQTILMKYHILFLSKTGKDSAKFVVIGALRVNDCGCFPKAGDSAEH